MVPLDRKSDRNNFQRGEDDCAQKRDNEEYDEFDGRNFVSARHAWVREFREKKLPDRSQTENNVSDVGNLSSEETGSEIDNPRSPTFSGRQENTKGVNGVQVRQLVRCRNGTVRDDDLGERNEHSENTIDEYSDNTCIRGSIFSMAKIAVAQKNHQEKGDDEG